jgi:hypothetical protein
MAELICACEICGDVFESLYGLWTGRWGNGCLRIFCSRDHMLHALSANTPPPALRVRPITKGNNEKV